MRVRSNVTPTIPPEGDPVQEPLNGTYNDDNYNYDDGIGGDVTDEY